MIPFHVEFRPGVSVYEQIVYAAKRAMVSGRIPPGTPFPSVRTLSRELKINPNTAHKVITKLITDGLLETKPGVGTVAAERVKATAAEKTELLGREIEQLVVDAKKLGIDLVDVTTAVSNHWKRLSQKDGSDNTTGERKRK